MTKNVFFIILILGLLPSLVQAEDLQISEVKAIQDLIIDRLTLQKGYTLSTPTQEFFLGIRPEVLSQESRVVIKQYDKSLFTFPTGLKAESDVYEFDILNQQAFNNKKPLMVRFNLNSVKNDKRLFFYNGKIKKWVELPSWSDSATSVKANIHLPYAKIVVLSRTDKTDKIQYGHASWYAYKNCDCAASTEYPKGSYVRVTNLDNGKSVIVKINDYGPDRSLFPQRVIDLDKVAFEKIGNLRVGILKNVKVERIQ